MNVHEMPKYPCAFCKKEEATQLCDFVVDYQGAIFLSPRMGGPQPPSPSTCDNQVCKECMTQYEGHEFCPDCVELHAYIKKNHVSRKGRLMADITFGHYEEV